MTESAAVERTLAAARAAFVAPGAARARLRAGLQASGAFGATTALPPAPSPGAIGRVGVAPWTVSVLVALGFAAGYWLGHAPAPGSVASPTPAAAALSPAALSAAALAPPERALAPVPVVETPVAPTSNPRVARSSDETRPSAERAHAPRPRSRAGLRSAPSSPANGFAQELALLQRAERALRAGEAALSLSLVGELERRYPASTLSEERAAVRILAECSADLPGARTRAERFLGARLASVYTDRVRRVCELGELVLPSGEPDGSRSPGH
ncbi:MAG: hypothetical protein ABI895_26780 [Deltaproteobacteria bacterium]